MYDFFFITPAWVLVPAIIIFLVVIGIIKLIKKQPVIEEKKPGRYDINFTKPARSEIINPISGKGLAVDMVNNTIGIHNRLVELRDMYKK